MPAAPESVLLFSALPGVFLLLSPELRVEAASDEYLAAALTTREQLVGQVVFDAFPDNPAAPEAHATRNLRASLTQVLATGQAHQMALQHYDVPDPTQPGGFLERHWLPTNRPVLDAQGHVAYIIHTVVDVTAQHAADRRLHESRAAEEVARAEGAAQRQRFYEVLMALPAQIAAYHGPNHIFNFVNAAYRRYFPTQALPGRSLREVLPEAEGQGVLALMDRVYQTGESSYQQELEVWLDFEGTGQPRQLFLNLLFHPLRNAQGRVDGLLDFSYDVTEQVQARRQVEQLNQELETRVAERTQTALALQAELLAAAEHQVQARESFYQVFEQTPAAVSLLRGPSYRIEYVNPVFQQVFAGRQLVGRDFAEALPDAATQGFLALLEGVYQTGETYFGAEVPLVSEQSDAPTRTTYFNFTYQAYRESGEIVGISTFALDVTEQVLARREREAQRQRLGEVFAQAPVAICVLQGPDYVLDVVNPRMYQLWDRTREDMIGRPFFEALPELRTQGLPELLADVRRTGQPFAAQEREVQLARHQPGETGFYDFVYEPLRDAQNQVVAVLCVATDVTEQVQARRQVEQLNAELEARVQERTRQLAAAQAEAERERAQLQALLEQAPVAIALFQGPEVRVASANGQMAALWGRTPAQVVGRTLLEAVPELRGQGFEEMIQQVLATRVPYVGTEAPATILIDGQLASRYYNFSCQPIYTAQGEVLGVLNVGIEVTEQVESRRALEQLNQELESRVQERTQQLRHQQGLLRQILRQVPAAIATVSGPEHRYSFFNDAYQVLSGTRTRLELPVAEVFPEVVAQGFIDLLDQVYATGQPVSGTATPAQLFNAATGQPELRYVDFIYQPLVNEQHQTEDILAFILDVTDQVLARQQVESLNQELAASNEEVRATNQALHRTNTQLRRTNTDLDTFVYAASHDLKAPIANIEGLLGALREYLPTQEQEPMVPRLVGMMEGAITRFQQTVGHLTDVSRLQSEATSPPETVDLPAVLDNVRLDLLPLLESTRAELVLDLTECAPVAFSAKHLRSVLFNLLSNAVKYRAPDRTPRVQVRTQCTATHLVLDVQDNGLGLDAKQQNALFIMFRRLHTHVEGSGVGLYLIKRTLENAGGTIAVRSQPGVGSTFTVTIPRA